MASSFFSQAHDFSLGEMNVTNVSGNYSDRSRRYTRNGGTNNHHTNYGPTHYDRSAHYAGNTYNTTNNGRGAVNNIGHVGNANFGTNHGSIHQIAYSEPPQIHQHSDHPALTGKGVLDGVDDGQRNCCSGHHPQDGTEPPRVPSRSRDDSRKRGAEARFQDPTPPPAAASGRSSSVARVPGQRDRVQRPPGTARRPGSNSSDGRGQDQPASKGSKPTDTAQCGERCPDGSRKRSRDDRPVKEGRKEVIVILDSDDEEDTPTKDGTADTPPPRKKCRTIHVPSSDQSKLGPPVRSSDDEEEPTPVRHGALDGGLQNRTAPAGTHSANPGTASDRAKRRGKGLRTSTAPRPIQPGRVSIRGSKPRNSRPIY